MLKAVVFYMALLLPFCFFLQKLLFKTVKIERQMGEQVNLPILYFTQLMGLALGLDERRLGLGRLFVSPSRVLSQV